MKVTVKDYGEDDYRRRCKKMEVLGWKLIKTIRHEDSIDSVWKNSSEEYEPPIVRKSVFK
jgi:hypothetical protein